MHTSIIILNNMFLLLYHTARYPTSNQYNKWWYLPTCDINAIVTIYDYYEAIPYHGFVWKARIFEFTFCGRQYQKRQFESQCSVNLIFNVESIWISILSQFDFQCSVNLTFNVELIWLSMLSQFDSQSWVNLTLNV